MPRPVITLLTDFGERDLYVGVMKGVIAGICPDANVIDITHDVPPQDVETGAFLLAHAFSHFPASTIHVAVVDPGVGTSRRPIAIRSGDHTFIGPDNGLFTMSVERANAHRAEQAHVLSNAKYFREVISSTFHGRDIFAPVAAHVANGVALEALGPRVSDCVEFRIAPPRNDGTSVHGQVVLVDRFGNLITNLGPEEVARRDDALVEIEGIAIGPVRTTYDDGPLGAPTALFGSFDLLEIAIRNGSAAKALALGRGARVTIRHAP